MYACGAYDRVRLIVDFTAFLLGFTNLRLQVDEVGGIRYIKKTRARTHGSRYKLSVLLHDMC